MTDGDNIVIQAESLSKDYISPFLKKRSRVLENLTLQVRKGETFGLIGLNGAGKTTTLKLLLGLLRPSSGKAFVLSYPAGDLRALARVGFLPENPHFYSYLTAFEFLDLIGEIFALPAKERKRRALGLLQMVSMEKNAGKMFRKFSKGMMQRLGIAQSLMNDPEIIFWDEPMSGLDPIGRRDVRQILQQLKLQGKTIFFNSHLLPDVNEVCDRVGVLHKGSLVAVQAIKEISGNGHYKDLEDYFLATVQRAESQMSSG